MAKFFKIPFAATGDILAVPDATQPDGSVSYSQGFGPDYQRKTDGTDPLAKTVPRNSTNALFNDLTGAVGEIQLNGVPAWQSVGAPYPINAIVRRNNKNWISQVANNSETPVEGASWSELPTNSYTKAQVDTKLATKANTATTLSGYGITDAYTKTQVDTALSGKANTATTLGGYGITDAYTKTEGDARYLRAANNLSDLTNKATARASLELGSAAQATLVSSLTDVTAGRALIVGYSGLGAQLNTADNASLNTESFTRFRGYGAGTVGAPTTNIGAAIVVCRGTGPTVIAIDYITGDIYYRPIGSAQSWRKFFHSSNVTPYIQTLFDDADASTARATLGVVEGVGQGQTWQDVSGDRSPNTTYTNNTGRTIGVLVTASTGNTTDYSVNGNVIATSAIVGGGKANAFFLVPPGATYGTGSTVIGRWMELR